MVEVSTINREYAESFISKVRALRKAYLEIMQDDILMTETVYADIDPLLKGLILGLTINVPDELESLDKRIHSIGALLEEWEMQI